MKFTHLKRFVTFYNTSFIFAVFITAVILQSCTSQKKIYKSDCNDGLSFKRVGFTQLIDSIEIYDQQFVEVTGTYKESKDESALFNDSLFVSHSNSHAIWVNFSQDCPLYLTGTHIGLFEFNDGKFTQISNKTVTIRGKIDVAHKGHLGSYRGSIDRVSFVKL
ncbi:MAG: hypothetical protein JWP94_2813 [Mucilaginibacter sp.]|nr:hypothetical protein [Mucilaginibacter sp.]